VKNETNPVVRKRFINRLAKFVLHLIGWKTRGQVPAYPKYVMIGYPHTSNWDALHRLI